MINSILKLFLPKSKTLAKLAAEKITKVVNNSEKQVIIAKYAVYAKEINDICFDICKWLEDGTINEKEEEEITKKLQPLFQNVIDLI